MKSICLSPLLLLTVALAHPANASAPAGAWGKMRTETSLGPEIVLAKPTTQVPAALLKQFPMVSYRHFTVDIDQDDAMDFIAESKKPKTFESCFVKSDLSIKSCVPMGFANADGFAYEFFVSLGKASPLVLFDLSGDEDSSQYKLKEFDSKTWKLSTVASVFPVVDSNGPNRKGLYWGYPWDIRSIQLDKSGGGSALNLMATFDHTLDQDREESSPGPAILFTGTASQGGAAGTYNNLKSKFRPMSVVEIKAEMKKRSSPQKK